MTTEQTCLLPSIAEERLGYAIDILQRFMDWHATSEPLEGDRKAVAWFAHQVQNFLDDPNGPSWRNV